MSAEYDLYLQKHKENVRKGFQWLQTNLPQIFEGKDDSGCWNIIFDHDSSKSLRDEYEAYDKYFYGGNKSYVVVQEFKKAWLNHIHRNPHHWQHWILISDDPNEKETVLEMPFKYIIEMICDWWSFSWQNGDLSGIFDWYDEHKDYIKLGDRTRETVEDILWGLRGRLGYNVLAHHGIKGQKWGVRNGPPYPLDKSRKRSKIVDEAIESGEVSKIINSEKQRRHNKNGHVPGRSYLNGDEDFAQELVDKYYGTGEAICIKDKWTHKEHIVADSVVGTYVDINGENYKSNHAIIIYSKTGAHIYPSRKDDDNET